nr:serine/threonine protein kinase [Thermomonas sp.]
MDSERWQRVWALFHDALDRPVEAREAWLRDAAAGDAALHDEVASLLRAHTEGASPLDRPPPAPPALDTVKVGDCLGPWRLLREIGAGGMGRVFEVERADGRYAQRAALKRLAPELAHPAFVGRFERERQIMAALEHPHIARLLDGGSSADGLPWLVMEYVDGAPIDRWCARQRLPLRERLRLVAAVCDAVDHAHRHLVVHRDLKPSNVLVGEDGVPHLVDFGIAA